MIRIFYVIWKFLLGVIHIWLPLWGGGVLRQKWDVIGRRGWGVSECSGGPIFFFVIKENWIYAITIQHAEPKINTLLTRNLPFDSDARQWRNPLIIPVHCLWLNLTIERVLSLNVTCCLVLFLFWFRSFTCTVRLLFHSLLIFLSCTNKTGWLQNK